MANITQENIDKLLKGDLEETIDVDAKIINTKEPKIISLNETISVKPLKESEKID